ncbi:hypothetical protein KSS87_001538 [Heliosperma pusillum]|nr:hypothetical protein KSS87_001538 [Heliosperma pusillum]
MKEESQKELQCKQGVMKQERRIVHTTVTMKTMGNEARKSNCSHKELQMQTMGNEARKNHCSHNKLQCKQLVMKQERLIVHTRSYNANNG